MKKLPVLILHGWNLPSTKYRSIERLLKEQGHQVYIPDLPGFGSKGDLTKAFSLNDYADYVLSYMKKNNLRNPIVISHSFGGRIAILLSSQQKNIFSKMILTGVPGYPPVWSFKVKVYKQVANLGNSIFSLRILNYFKGFFRKLLYFSAGSFDYYKTSGELRETFKNVISYDLRPLFPKIKIPTLIVWGGEDTVTPIWIAHKMHTEINNSRLEVLPGEGHNVVYLNPSLFMKHV